MTSASPTTSSPKERCTIRPHAGSRSPGAIVAALVGLAAGVAHAQEPAGAPASFNLHGFALVEGTGKLARSAIFFEERLRADVTASAGPAAFVARVDLLHDTALPGVEVDPRELYVTFSVGPI